MGRALGSWAVESRPLAPSISRNPDGDVQPWCYVAETEEGIYWRYCDIPTCHSEWAQQDRGGGAGVLGREAALGGARA